MTGLVRFNPVPELQDLHTTVNRFFNEAFPRFFEHAETTRHWGTWTPVVDVYETEEDVTFNAELPGFDKEEINISVRDGRLTLTGERKFTEDKRTYQLVERWYGNFNRTFLLPATVDYNHISANLKNGILTITIPKKEEAKAKQISVSVQ